MNEPIYCLPPHGYLRLIDYMGSDWSIVKSARVSINAEWRTGEDAGKDAKLIHRLWRDRHTSPFEAVTITVEVQAPLFVFREWHRHRTQSFSEISARYSELPELFYLPTPNRVGLQNPKNKQGSIASDDPEILIRRAEEIHELDEHCRKSFELYRKFLASGQPRECARFVLPVNTFSRMFATANLLNWFRFLTLRTAEVAQWEIRHYAQALLTIIEPVAPIAIAAWRTYPLS